MRRSPEAGLAITRFLARVLLRFYPGDFRTQHGRHFVELAGHHWAKAHHRRGAVTATLATGWLLCADTVGAAPGAWRAASGGRGLPDDPGAAPPRRRRLLAALGGVGTDVRMALRLVRREPATAALLVATLALGIGASTSAFAALDGVVLHPLPFEHGDRLRYLALEHRAGGWWSTPDGEIVERWREAATSLERVESYRDGTAVVITEEGAERRSVALISIGMPGMLGVRPLTGRLLTEGDAASDAPPALMVTERYWRRQLAGRPDVVGSVIPLTTGPATIVGVWPSAARFHREGTPDFIRMVPRSQEFRQGSWTNVLALLRPGVAGEAVLTELESLADGLGRPDRAEYGVAVLSPSGLVGDAYLRGLWTVFGGALVLLVVSIVNASNLLLGRASTRGRELGVRLALGGSRLGVMRLFLIESLLLTTAGAVAGLGVAALTTTVYATWEPVGLVADRGHWLALRPLAFGAAAAAMAALVAGLFPAWRATAGDARGILGAGDDGRVTASASRLRGTLVGAQAALAVLLVAGAALTARSYSQLASVDPGFDVEGLAMVSVSAPASRYPTREQQQAFIASIREAIAALPQVEDFTITGAPPFQTSTSSGALVFEGEAEPDGPVTKGPATQGADEGFFRVFGIPLMAGRYFEASDAGTDVVIVGQSTSRAHGGALGRRVRFSDDPNRRWWTVIGIVGDVSSSELTEDRGVREQLYFAERRDEPVTFARFIVRTAGDPAAAIATIRTRVAALDRHVPLSEAATLASLYEAQTSRHRFVAYLLGGLALFGVLFAVSGVYGVVSLDVAQRTREVGIRVALGSTTGRVVGHLARRGLRPVVAGTVLGVLGVLWVGPRAEALLFQVQGHDPWSLLIGVAFVLGAAALGSVLPARRAARVDPALALRSD